MTVYLCTSFFFFCVDRLVSLPYVFTLPSGAVLCLFDSVFEWLMVLHLSFIFTASFICRDWKMFVFWSLLDVGTESLFLKDDRFHLMTYSWNKKLNQQMWRFGSSDIYWKISIFLKVFGITSPNVPRGSVINSDNICSEILRKL